MGVVPAFGGQAFPPTHPRGVLRNLGDTPRPPPEGDSPSSFGGQVCALPLLVVDVVALAEIRKRTYWEAGESQVTPVYLNEYQF